MIGRQGTINDESGLPILTIDKTNNFAILHVIGAVMVTWGHSFALLQTGAPELCGDAMHVIGLYILMCISGFLVMNSMKRCSNVLEFYWKRFSRIYPSLIFALILTVLMLSADTTVGLRDYLHSAAYYVKHQLAFSYIEGIAGVFKHTPYKKAVNGSLWSLQYEVLFYILMSILLFKMRKSKNKVLFVSAGIYAAGVICAVWIKPVNTIIWLYWSFSVEQIVRVGTFFAAGIFYSLIPEQYRRVICRPEAVIAIICIQLCMGGLWNSDWNYIWIPYGTITIALFGKRIATSFFNRWDIAYEIYLLSFPIQQRVIEEMAVNRQLEIAPMQVFFISMLIVIPLSLTIKRMSNFVINRIRFN